MNKNLFTYKKSGVNINAADKFVSFISSISSKKRGNKKNANIGGFGSVTDLPKNIKNPKIVSNKRNNFREPKLIVIIKSKIKKGIIIKIPPIVGVSLFLK